MTFDAAAYKATTKQQWDEAAAAWHRWGPTLEDWLGAATKAMLDAAGVTLDSRVLDIAGGAGGQALAAAHRTGARGSVVVTDVSPGILGFAARAAAEAGLQQVTTVEVDGEEVGSRWAEDFDAAISRLGLIYFADRQRALRGIRSSLREGGRFAAVVYASADRNGFFSVPVGIIRNRAGLPAPVPGQPGPFSLGDAQVARTEFESAGFREVQVETLSAPLLLRSAADCLRFERESFGALHQMLSGVEDTEAVWSEVQVALESFDLDGGFVGPCELHIISGVR
jgi:SAM-dependent methyltransferase